MKQKEIYRRILAGLCFTILAGILAGCSSQKKKQEGTTEKVIFKKRGTETTEKKQDILKEKKIKEIKGVEGENKLYYIRVNRKTNCVTVYKRNKRTGNYAPIKSMICSVGRNGGTPCGTFPLREERYAWHLLFGDVYGRYAVRITGNILFHSVPYLEKDEKTLQWEEYQKLGNSVSDGCVRLEKEDAKWIYQHCRKGTIVKIFDGTKKDDPLGRPEKRLKIEFKKTDR